MQKIVLDSRLIVDWTSFHNVFADLFGLPAFYGRNMNAWIDCVSSLDDPDSGMTSVAVAPGEVVLLHVDHANDFAKRCPEPFSAMVDGVAFVNWRRSQDGESALIALAYCKPV